MNIRNSNIFTFEILNNINLFQSKTLNKMEIEKLNNIIISNRVFEGNQVL